MSSSETPLALATRSGALRLPAFLPDATRGAVRCVDADDLSRVGIRGLMVNGLHVARRPGVRLVKQLGGLHRFMGWDGPIVTDSGGFQVLSMIRRDAKLGSIRPNEVVFHDPDDGEKVVLDPETSVRNQLRLGTDVVVALDDCTGPDDPPDEVKRAVERTVRWFRVAKAEFDRSVERDDPRRPLLVGVVQGGSDLALRTECARALAGMGADAFGFGGWPVDERGRVRADAVAATREGLPEGAVLFALGIGKPEHLVALAAVDPRLVFDCTLPTRDARHHRLYAFLEEPRRAPAPGEEFYRFVHVLDGDHAMADGPASPGCDCPLCARYSLAYLHHLFKAKDGLAPRLATLHNLRFYTRLVELLQERAS